LSDDKSECESIIEVTRGLNETWNSVDNYYLTDWIEFIEVENLLNKLESLSVGYRNSESIDYEVNKFKIEQIKEMILCFVKL
jgi:hypothetical protein